MAISFSILNKRLVFCIIKYTVGLKEKAKRNNAHRQAKHLPRRIPKYSAGNPGLK